MKRFLHRALIAGVAAGFLWTLPATAQRRGNHDVNNALTANQIVDMADARIASLKADLRLTPDQEKNWSGFQGALHNIAVQRADEFEKPNANAGANSEASTTKAENSQPGAPSATGDADNDTSAQNQPDTTTSTASAQNPPPEEIQSLRDQANALNHRADELKKIADAAQPLYVSLDDTQRSQLMNFIRSNGGGDQATSQRRRRR